MSSDLWRCSACNQTVYAVKKPSRFLYFSSIAFVTWTCAWFGSLWLGFHTLQEGMSYLIAAILPMFVFSIIVFLVLFIFVLIGIFLRLQNTCSNCGSKEIYKINVNNRLNALLVLLCDKFRCAYGNIKYCMTVPIYIEKYDNGVRPIFAAYFSLALSLLSFLFPYVFLVAIPFSILMSWYAIKSSKSYRSIHANIIAIVAGCVCLLFLCLFFYSQYSYEKY